MKKHATPAVVISSFFQILNLKNALLTLLMCSFFKNNQAKDVPPTAAMKKHATPAVVISSFFQIINLKNAILTLLMCSFIKNNQAKDVPPTAAMKKHATPAVPERTVTTRSKAPTVTEPTASASADAVSPPDGEDAEIQITPTENLTSRGSNSPQDNQIVITKQKGTHIFTSICLLLVTTKLL